MWEVKNSLSRRRVQRGKPIEEIVNILAKLKLYIRGEKGAAERCRGGVKR